MDKIAVLIPCYNEAQTIEKVVTDARNALPDATIYVYDNNSTDGTAEIAEKAGAVIRHEYMQGKGNVIRRMFREIDAECYLMIDGDDTYPLDYLPLILQKTNVPSTTSATVWYAAASTGCSIPISKIS